MQINFEKIEFSDLTTILISVVTAFIAWQAWEAQKSNNLIYLNEMIENARNGYTEMMRLKIESNKENLSSTQEYKDLFLVTIENLVNAYESASAFYLSGWWFFGVINKKIFKESRKKEIIELVENQEIRKIIPNLRESYTKLWKAYIQFVK